MARTRESVVKDVPHVNGTPRPDAGFGKKMYDACVAQCSLRGAGRPRRLPCVVKSFVRFRCGRHARAVGRLLDEDLKYWFHFGWVTTAHWFLIFYLALVYFRVWTLACRVSNRCCYAFGTLQKISATSSAYRAPRRDVPEQAMRRAECWVGRCCCCCMCCKATRVKKPDLQTAIEVTAQGPPGTP